MPTSPPTIALERQEQIVEVAELDHLAGLNQSDITGQQEIACPAVLRMLAGRRAQTDYLRSSDLVQAVEQPDQSFC